jgi:hypothetical protein
MWIRNSFSISCCLILENFSELDNVSDITLVNVKQFYARELGTGAAGTLTLCLGGTGNGMHYGSVSGAGIGSGSGAGFGSGFDMKWDKKGKKNQK